jgi:hypothetical protein
MNGCVTHSESLRVSFGRLVRALCPCLVLLVPVAASGDCPPSPTTYLNGVIEGPVTSDSVGGRHCSLAIDALDRFIIAYQTPSTTDNDVYLLRFGADGGCICLTGDECPARLTEPPTPNSTHNHISVAL